MHPVVQVGDVLDIRVVDSAGHLIAQPTTYTVTSEMLEMAFISVALDVAPLPTTTLLLQNYPNPFNPETWIPYQLSEAAPVTITIYNVAGQVVRSLGLGHQEAGFYRGRSQAAYWDGRNNQNEQVASGIYQTPRCQGFPSLQETGDVDIAQHLVEKKKI